VGCVESACACGSWKGFSTSGLGRPGNGDVRLWGVDIAGKAVDAAVRSRIVGVSAGVSEKRGVN